ncbi:MAG: ABC transporter ATP-binding protein [Flavobacteriales bacterium]
MIQVKNLYKSFGDVQILNGISAEFQKGKTNLIIGQSGSGKTVFLKCLLGLFEASSGEILYEGISSQEMTFKEQKQLRADIGMVFQGSALFDYMTVEENVMFPLKMFTKMSLEEMLNRVNEVLERVKLPDSNLKLPSELSGGMQKRVAIARAIVNNPKYLFCDEPNSGLDPKTAIVIDNLISEITEEYNTTTIINSHDMNSVMEIGETIIYLRFGDKVWEGTKEDLLTTNDENILDFVYSSNLMKKLRKLLLK